MVQYLILMLNQCSSPAVERFMLIFTIDGRQIISANTLLFPPQLCNHYWWIQRRVPTLFFNVFHQGFHSSLCFEILNAWSFMKFKIFHWFWFYWALSDLAKHLGEVLALWFHSQWKSCRWLISSFYPSLRIYTIFPRWTRRKYNYSFADLWV